MAICPICGCKTEDIDIVKGSVNGVEKSICSFCERQLHGFEDKEGEQLTEAQLRWLTAVMEKDVPQRDEETFNALRELYNKFRKEDELPPPPVIPQRVPANSAVGQFTDKNNLIDDKDDVINKLSLRVEALEKEIVTMKRKQIIKTIIELGVPIILLIIILIVFFSSGLFDRLAGLTDLLNEFQ